MSIRAHPITSLPVWCGSSVVVVVKRVVLVWSLCCG